jgi:hypothetical protein
MIPLYIFDLDGTLALIDHRKHFITGDVKDWDAFFAACVYDKPNHAVIDILHAVDEGANLDVWIWTGRSDSVRVETDAWLRSNSIFVPIKMRKEGDRRDDIELKAAWLDDLAPSDRRRIAATFEDRDRVVAMWRSKGITCFQVAPGNF